MLDALAANTHLLPPGQALIHAAVSNSILHSLSKAAVVAQEESCTTRDCTRQSYPATTSMRETTPLEPLSPSRTSKPRIYKEQRRRRREDTPPRGKYAKMEASSVGALDGVVDGHEPLYMDRTSLCLPSFEDEAIVHAGDDGYGPVLRQYFPAAESNATERLVRLKSQLKAASTYDFWQILMEEMCDIFSAQCGYVAKRILVDVDQGAVEMPALGEPGSCLMGTAFYLNSNDVVKQLHRDYRYTAYGTPCAHMKHDKVFIIPERMSEVITDNPNDAILPWDKSEAYIGVPLFQGGKAFAHFGMIWSTEGAARRNVSWNYVEMFMHSLEDLIQERIVEGRGFVKDSIDQDASKIVPLAAITPAQSLKPYARNLSHELRTPMQGVVGMLDIMYSTVLEAIASQTSEQTQSVFRDLKSHIEVVQESSKRAVDAADNVVHAYDMNMQMPDAPLTPDDLSSYDATAPEQPFFHVPQRVEYAEGMRSPGKRMFESESAIEGPPSKKSYAVKEADDFRIIHTNPVVSDIPTTVVSSPAEMMCDETDESRLPSPALVSTSFLPTQQVDTRDFLTGLVISILKSSRPIKFEQTHIDHGEKIEVQTLSSRNQLQNRTIYVQVDPRVPTVIETDPQPLQFSLQKIIDNAIKFTESGSISITARIGVNDDKVEFCIADTGCGIDEAAMQGLFKPHFQQDASISRARDGMGLSLFNAKAHIRRSMGGDVTLEHSATNGPRRGSEFLVRLPMSRNPSNDKTIVGTPPSSSHSSHRAFFADMKTSPRLSTRSPLLEGMPLPSIEHDQQPVPQVHIVPPKNTSRKRTAVNANLARDYPLNILIAEDNPVNRKVAVGSLSKLGYTKDNITVAFDGQEAVSCYQGTLEQPGASRFDIILMDIWMPKMDGYEATMKIKQLAAQAGTTIPTIAVTADITSESRDRAKDVGMDGFLPKPYKVVDFEKLIIEQFSKMDVDS